MKKRILSLILALCALAALTTALAVTVFAADTMTYKASDRDVTYTYDKITETLTVTGTGIAQQEDVIAAKEAFENAGATFSPIHLVIGEDIEDIYTNQFLNCTSLQSVTVRGNTGLGSHTFEGCTGLTSVTFLSNAEIGNSTFNGCAGLTSIVIPGKAQIGASAFCGCTNLASVTVGGDVRLGSGIFYGCNNLKNVYFFGGVFYMGTDPFRSVDRNLNVYIGTSTAKTEYESQFTNSYIKVIPMSGSCGATENDNVTWRLSADGTMTISGSGAMADYIVSDNSGDNRPWASLTDMITSVVVEDGVTSVGNMAFTYCINLTSADIADSVAMIGESAFERAALTSVTLGGSDVVIKASAFIGCKLTSVVIGGNAAISEMAFAANGDLTSVYFFGNATFGTSVFNRVSGELTIYGYSYNSALQQYCQDSGINFAPLNGDCGDTMIWSLAADGTLTVQGSGAMYDYSSTSSTAAPWKDLVENGLVKRFVIEKEITYESLGVTPKYTVVICDGTGDGKGKDVLATYVFMTDGEKVPTPDTPERNGYKFLGWHASGSEYYFGNSVSSDLLITAVWEKPDYIKDLEDAISNLETAVNGKADTSELYDAIDDVQTAIDDLKKELNNKVGTTDFNSLLTEVNDVQTEIGKIQSRLALLETEDDNLQQQINDLSSELTSFQSDLTTLKSKVTELETSIGKLQTAQTTLENALTNKAGKDELKNATDKLDDAIAQLETLKTKLADTDAALTKRIDELIGGATGTLKDAEDRLAALESEVADLGGQITNLEKAQKRLDNDLATKANAADVTKNVNALHDEIAKLNTALNGKVSQSDYDTLKAAVTALQSAVATLNAAKDDYKSADEALEKKLNDAIKNANDAQDAVIKALTDRVTAAEEEIKKLQSDKADTATVTAAVEELQKAIDALEAVKDDYKGADDDLEKRLTAAIESAKDSAIKTAETLVNNAKTELNEEIEKKADATALADAIDTLNKAIAAAQQAAQDYADGKDKTLNQAIANAQTTLKGLIDDVQKNLDDAKAELNTAIANGDKELNEKIAALNTALETAKTVLEKADSDNKTELNKAIADAQTTLKGLIDDVQKNLDDAKAELNIAIANGDKELSEKIAALNTALETAKTVLEKADSDNKAELNKAIADAQNSLQSAIDKVASDLAAAKAELEAKDAELEAKNSDQDAKDAELEAQNARQQTFITVVCIIACLSSAGNIAIAGVIFVLKRKRTL